MSIIERRAITVVITGVKRDDVLDVAQNIKQAAARYALTVYGGRPVYARLRGVHFIHLLVIGGKEGLKNLMKELPALSEYPRTEVRVRRFMRPALRDWAMVTVEATEAAPSEFVKAVLDVKSLALSKGLNVRGPRWYPVVAGEPRKAVMAVTGDHRDIRDFINAVSEKYAESVWGPVFLPLRVRVPAPTGRLTGVRIDIKLLRLHPWARPELQI